MKLLNGLNSRATSILEAAKFLLSIVASQSSIILSPLIIRSLGYQGFGLLELSLSIAGVFGIFLSCGLHQLIGVRYAKEPGNVVGIVKILLYYLLLAVPLMWMLATNSSATWLSKILLLEGGSGLVQLALLVAFVSNFKHLALSLAAMSFRTNDYLILEVSGALIYFSGIAIMYRLDAMSVEWVLVIHLLAYLPVFVYGMRFWGAFSRSVHAIWVSKWRWLKAGADILSTLKVSLPLMLSGLLLLAGGVSDRILLSLLGVGAQEIGAYSLSYKIAGIIPILATYLIGNLHSRELYRRCAALAKDGGDSVAIGLKYSVRIGVPVTVGAGVLLAMYFWIVSFLLEPIYQKEFDSLIGFSILLAGFWLTIPISFVSAPLIFSERTNSILISIAASASLNIGLNVLMIPGFGAESCAWIFLISNAVRLALLLGYARGLYRVHHSHK